MKRGFSLKAIKNLDRSGMLQVLLDFPSQCLTARGIAESAKIKFSGRDFKNIIFSGVGASGMGGDLLRSYLYHESRLPISVVRDYELPAFADKDTLLFISSYSGNTEEAFYIWGQAKKIGIRPVILSSGGRLEELAFADNETFVRLPKGLPPRLALGYLSIIPLCLLVKLGLIEDKTAQISAMSKILEELKKNCLNPRVAVKDNVAKYAAQKLFNKLVFIYTNSIHFDVAGTRLRTQLAENPKAIASGHLFPEMNHNEIAAWQNPKKLFKDCALVFLRDKDINPRINKRIELTKSLLSREGLKTMEIWSRGEDTLSKIFSLIYTGDFISYYLALLYGVDPTPVERINYIKEELRKYS